MQTVVRKSACSLCRGPNDRADKGQAYCRACHNAYCRENNPRYRDFSPEAKRKANVRAHAGVFYRRDHPEYREPCSICGAEKAEKHHGDYRLPLAVRWLCRTCHREHHQQHG